MQDLPRPSGDHYRRVVSAAIALSIVLHGSAWLWSRSWGELPKLDFELVKPSAVEFGVMEPPAPAAPAPLAEPQPQTVQPTGSTAAPEPKSDSGKAAPKRSKTARAPEPANAFPEAGQAGRLAPRGSQIALRVDVERIDAGPLASDVGQLLAAIPDVHWLLADSGVDPMHDLSRMFIASPDLRREHVVLAGRYRGSEAIPRAAVARLAEQRGQAATWRSQRGITMAPWLNQSTQPRVLALLGPALFAIARDEDLSRVLAVARSLQAAGTGARSASEALVHMADHELMNLAVENARSFVRGARGAQVPERFTLSVRAVQPASGGLDVTFTGRYPDAEQARTALVYWEALRDRYASNALLALLGAGALLRSTQLSTRNEALTMKVRLSVAEARLLLRFVRDSLHTPGGS